jgi:hypothetical protein
MTTCIPIKPFRCWQYRKGEPVPDWARDSVTDGPGEGWWLVQETYGGKNWYTPAEFAERFKIVEDALAPSGLLDVFGVI